MLLDTDGNITTVFQEEGKLEMFLINLNEGYSQLQDQHLILNLNAFGNLSAGELEEFIPLSSSHRAKRKSFVLVTNTVPFEEVPEVLCLVPTLQEARDIIELEEIERDLGF
jgi:hypothetical protein